VAIIAVEFPEAGERAKAMSAYTFVVAGGASLGLLLGGVLTQAISWHWIFFVNLPVGVATALAARRLVPDGPGIGLRAGADVPGALLITSALMLGVYTIVDPAAKQGWGASSTLLLGAGSIALLFAFLVREARAASPLMPLRIFRSRPILAANAIQILRSPGCSGCSSSARCICGGCSATTRCASDLRSYRSRSQWGRCRSAIPSGC